MRRPRWWSDRASRSNPVGAGPMRFHVIGIHFDCRGLPDQVHGKHHSQAPGLAHQKPRQIRERAGFDPHLLANGQIGVRFKLVRLEPRRGDSLFPHPVTAMGHLQNPQWIPHREDLEP